MHVVSHSKKTKILKSKKIVHVHVHVSYPEHLPYLNSCLPRGGRIIDVQLYHCILNMRVYLVRMGVGGGGGGSDQTCLL